MSELKAEQWLDYAGEPRPCYPKSEADKVIAELKAQVHDYAQGLYVMQASAEKEARHHKYKRCVAMAMWCGEKWADIATPYCKSVWYRKWQLRWLELAEKFKEAK